MKTKFFLLYALGILSILFSCSDESSTTTEEIKSIELQIEEIHSTFVAVKESNQNAVLELALDGESLISEIKILDDDKIAQLRSSTSRSEPLCKGDGLGFAKCVKSALDKIGCVRIETCNYCAYACE